MKNNEILADASRMLQVGSSQDALNLLFDNRMLPGVTRVPTADGDFAYISSDGTPLDPAAVFASISSGRLSPYMNAQRTAENTRTIARMQQEGQNARALANIAAKLGARAPATKGDVVNLFDLAQKTRAAAYKEFEAALKLAEPAASGPRATDVQSLLDTRVQEARRAVLAANQDFEVLRKQLAAEPQLEEPVSRYPPVGTTAVTSAVSIAPPTLAPSPSAAPARYQQQAWNMHDWLWFPVQTILRVTSMSTAKLRHAIVMQWSIWVTTSMNIPTAVMPIR
jgi:hypothetical protein